MNAVTSSGEELIADDVGSDTDTNLDDSLEYYQPISAIDGGENGIESSDEDEGINHQLPNGYPPMGYGVVSLDLNDEDDDEEEEERLMETEVERSMREDERRRTALLTAENAGRVMEAMRGISFGGPPPSWAGRATEDQWIHQLRTRLRGTPPSVADSSPVQ